MSTKLENLFNKLATKEYKLHNFFKEWRVAIIIILAVKFLTMAISIFAGYNYFHNLLYSLFQNTAAVVIFAVLCLLFLELLTAFFLKKSFKFFLRKQLQTAILPLIAVVILFSISFFTSTNGLALRQAHKVDNTKMIVDNLNTQTSGVKQQYKQLTSNLHTQIELIKTSPEGWSGGKRTILLPNQLAKIDSLYNAIYLLNNDLTNELNEIEYKHTQSVKTNENHVKNESNKYYNIVAIIMFLQVLCNFALMFFWSRIYEDNEKENYTTEIIQTIGEGINQSIFNIMAKTLVKNTTMFMSTLDNESEKIEPVKIEKNNNKDTKYKAVATNENKRQIGFKVNNDSVNNDSVNNDSVNNVSVNNDSIMKCKQCGDEFVPYNIKHIYCSSNCRLKWHKENNGFDLKKHIKNKGK